MSRKKDPAVLFYTSDFLTGTSGLTFEERGKYITLLCLQHQRGHLSPKQIKLAVGTLSDDVLSKFKQDDKGKYYNERMEFEGLKRQKYAESRIENGRKGGRPPNENKNHMDNHMDNHMHNHMGNHTENENINENISNTLTKSNSEDISDIFSFSNNNNYNNNRRNVDSACERAKYENIEFEIFEYFAKHKFISNAEDFIAYNKSRDWRGIGGEDVLSDFRRYADRWEVEERRKRGDDSWKPPII